MGAEGIGKETKNGALRESVKGSALKGDVPKGEKDSTAYTNYVDLWFNEYPSIRRFDKLLKRKRIAPRTLEAYIKGVKEFCDLIGFDNPESALERVKTIENRESWLDDLITVFRDKGLSDTRILNVMKAVKSWLWLNGVDVDWREIVLPSYEAVIEDRAPTKEELRHLLSLGNLRDQALILVASSSGLGRETLRTLSWGDINFEFPDIARIMVKKEYQIKGETFTHGRKISKKRKFYVTFITSEAKQKLLEYKDWREKEGEKITDKSPLFTSMRRGELGQFIKNPHYIDVHWGRLLRKAHLGDKSKPWYTLHFHTLKKYAETQFINAGCNPSYREFWLGHKGAYLESSYFRGEESKHLEEYRKAVPYLELRERGLSEKERILNQIKLELATREMSEEKLRELRDLVQSGKMTVEDFNKAIWLLDHKDKTPIKKKHESEDCQRIVSEDQLSEYLSKGWRVVTALPSGRIIVSNES